jgi:hypothetical protein
MSKRFRQPAVGLVALLPSIVLATSLLRLSEAHAQSYTVNTPKLTDAQVGQLQSKVANIMRQTGAPSAADLKALDDYFLGYFFDDMTNASPAKLGQLAETRRKLFQQYLTAAKNAAARDHVANLTLRKVGTFVVGSYHPAVRYNSALILGQLDQAPATGGGPAPMPDATKALTMLLELPDYKGVPIPSSIRMAALIGLERHTRLGVDPQYTERITTEALEIANRQEPPADLSADVNNWMRCQAARVLANQFKNGLTAPVHQVLVTLVGTDQMSVDDRTRVAEMLVSTMYTGGQGVNVEEMATAVGALAKAVLADERDKAEDYEKEIMGNPGAFVGGGGGFGDSGGYGRSGYGPPGGRGGYGREGGGYTAPEEPQGPRYERRRMLERVLAVMSAASAIGAAGPDDLKQRMTALVDSLKDGADAASNDDTAELAVTEKVKELADEVGAMIDGWAAAGAAPAEGGAEPAGNGADAEGAEFGA